MSLTEEDELAIARALSMDDSSFYYEDNYSFGYENETKISQTTESPSIKSNLFNNSDSEILRMQQYYEYEESLKKDRDKESFENFEEGIGFEDSDDEINIEENEDQEEEEEEEEEYDPFYNANILENDNSKEIFYKDQTEEYLQDPVKEWIKDPYSIFSNFSTRKISVRVKFVGFQDQKPIDLALDPDEKIINIIKFSHLVTKNYDKIKINIASKFYDITEKDTLSSLFVKDRSLVVISLD